MVPPILPLVIALSLLAWAIIAWVHLVPWLDTHSRREGLLLVVMPHMFRHLGAMAMFPGLADVPRAWALPLAWGDGITAGLAAISMIGVHRSWRHAAKFVWVFNLFGLIDMFHNVYNAAALQVAPRLGVLAYVVGFGLPGMFVFHLLVFRTLLRRVEHSV